MLKKILLGLLAVIVLVLVFHSFIIGTVVKPQVEAQASRILGTPVKIAILSVRLWPGNAAIYGLKVKNPSGFSDAYLLDLGSFSVGLDVPGLAKQFSSGSAGPKTLVIDEVKVKNLKLLIEKIAKDGAVQSNVEALLAQLKSADKKAENAPPAEKKEDPAAKALSLNIELHKFDFSGGRVTFIDRTIGDGFEYVVDDINVDFRNIFVPAKPASELVETFDIAAKIGNDHPGKVTFQGKSNFMAGPNVQGKLAVEEAGISDFNPFLAEQPFILKDGKFSLTSDIEILNNQLATVNQLKLASMEFGTKPGGSQLLDLPLQTILTTLSRLPSIEFPFEVRGDLKNPQFKLTQSVKAAIAGGIQRVLAAGLGDIKGLAEGVRGQALGLAGQGADFLKEDAQTAVKDLAGTSAETMEQGLKKLSGLLGGKKSE